ncbi:MAG: M64 family metallopeptidase [Pseudobdellovibrionaceae bacterium]
MRLRFVIHLIALIFFAQSAQASWILKRIKQGEKVTPVGVSWTESDPNAIVPRTLRSFPAYVAEGQTPSLEIYEEIFWPSEELPASFAKFALSSRLADFAVAGTEVRTIVDQGNPANRICLTFIGDGYTEQEKERFFSDVARLVDDLFNGKTFASYTALFNVYAVFVPSQDSGITDVNRKNTAFGLYRSPAGSKRAIMPGNSYAIEKAIRLAPKTDYPVVIANDEFYGGLGGRYAITTRSIESGKIVLRHELGHNFGDVGEEYDNGSVYSGANSSSSPNVSWKHWIEGTPAKKQQDMRLLGGAYVWQNLAQGPVIQDFRFPAPNNKGSFWFEVQLSSVGWQTLEDVEILLDGRKLEITGTGTSDRSFFNTVKIQDLPPGDHTLEINEVKKDGDNILAFANLYAYEADYAFNGEISAFTTYDEWGGTRYRPTHQQCLMRDMLFEFFCPIDQENMWIRFFDRVRIIDAVDVGATAVELKSLKLANLKIAWFKKDGASETEMTEFRDQKSIDRNLLTKGSYSAKVEFQSSEIRKTSSRLKDTMSFEVL